MPQMKVVSIERDNCQRSLPEWGDALRTHVGHTPLAELTRCVPTGQRGFSGRIDCGPLDNAVLSKVAATPYLLSRSLRGPNPQAAPLLIAQVSGSSRVEQRDRSCTLHAGDLCLFDPLQPFKAWLYEARNEYLALTLERPSDPERFGLLEQGVARCWDAKAGISRVLLAVLTETFNQMNRLGPSSRKNLERALTELTWDAVREQLAAPAPGVHRNVLGARIKSCIERHIADPELSVDLIAQSLCISVRSVHRAFEADPAGSISNHIWMRRLSHCAASLRDPSQAHRSITDICFSHGFNSTSHFSRLFKAQFGVPPREYRMASERTSPTQELAA